jgi:hypothetical protein
VRRGRIWSVAFNGWETLVPNQKGMSYIARLLRHPHQSFHAADLSGHVGTLAAPNEDAPSNLEEALLVRESGNDPLLDDTARASLAQRLDELATLRQQAMASGGAELATEIDCEMEAITKHLKQATGLGGRSRRFMSSDEQARHRVTKAIKRAIESIGTVHPPLGRHLAAALHPGMYSEYRPESSIPWTVQIDETAPRH